MEDKSLFQGQYILGLSASKSCTTIQNYMNDGYFKVNNEISKNKQKSVWTNLLLKGVSCEAPLSGLALLVIHAVIATTS